VPRMPDCGPCNGWDGRPCRLGVHHLRDRKTGPCFPLTVVQCHTHGKAFTLYPPGHVPYGRKPIAPVAPDGSWPGRCEAEVFEGTVFEAAVDAAGGRAWPRFDEEWGRGGAERYWSTQCRWLQRSTWLLGLSEGLQAKESEEAAEVLGVERMLLHELSGEISKRPGYRSRGDAVCGVLGALSDGACVLDRLLYGGHLAGLWGKPFRWDPMAAVLRSMPFRISR